MMIDVRRLSSMINGYPLSSGRQTGPRAPSMYVRLIALTAVLTVFICSCCFCAVGMSLLKTKRKSNGRNQYVSKNRVIYEWDQTPDTITLYTKPPGRISEKNIEVIVWSNQLQIGRKDKDPFLKEPLWAAVDADTKSWKVSSEGELEICLEKVEAAEWPCVMPAHLKRESKGRGSSDSPSRKR